ncbi:Cofilin/actin-depolymerizing factor [Echinococcus granulosus]|uniref:Cofilin/actin-depolymerizing factor n=1 Tax=Echinococcus granulosus TaxID=6210 RepID=W6UIF3_ECHGR|nr:Cofilin/actin-depolymerizing factor [Echinococcus granulosus]EUB61250.1 Cofilin/actin-depolymerizing factor [Echinococcus granulosus]
MLVGSGQHNPERKIFRFSMVIDTSGVKCSDDCLAKYNELKLKKTCRYILYKIEDQKEIVIDQIGDRNCTFDQFKTELENLEKSARYAVLDFESDSNKSHLLFISWIPDNASVRERMLYASSVDALKSQLTGFKSYLQLNEKSDLTRENFMDSLPVELISIAPRPPL